MEKLLYHLPSLQAHDKLNHGFSVCEAGSMSFRWGEQAEVRKNREQFLRALSVNANNVVAAALEHGDTIAKVTTADTGHGILTGDYQLDADALITDEPNVYLFHTVADCASVMYYDRTHHAVALAHSGWLGTTKNLAGRVVERMTKAFGTKPEELTIGLGPAIHACCYAFPQSELQAIPDWEPYRKPDEQGLIHIDNIGFIMDQLIKTGVLQTHIYDSGICTAHDNRFFSHYRDKQRNLPEERFAALIGLQS